MIASRRYWSVTLERCRPGRGAHLLQAHRAMDLAREETYAVARHAQEILDPLPTPTPPSLQALALGVVDRVG